MPTPLALDEGLAAARARGLGSAGKPARRRPLDALPHVDAW
jgi:hypothetical protein